MDFWQVGKLALLCSVVDLLWGKLVIWREILTVTESNLSRLQVNFTKKFSIMEESFFNGGIGSYLGKFIMNPQPDSRPL